MISPTFLAIGWSAIIYLTAIGIPKTRMMQWRPMLFCNVSTKKLYITNTKLLKTAFKGLV